MGDNQTLAGLGGHEGGITNRSPMTNLRSIWYGYPQRNPGGELNLRVNPTFRASMAELGRSGDTSRADELSKRRVARAVKAPPDPAKKGGQTSRMLINSNTGGPFEPPGFSLVLGLAQGKSLDAVVLGVQITLFAPVPDASTEPGRSVRLTFIFDCGHKPSRFWPTTGLDPPVFPGHSGSGPSCC